MSKGFLFIGLLIFLAFWFSLLELTQFMHQVTLVAGLSIILYALVGNAGDWKEFYQYFRESKFVSPIDVFIFTEMKSSFAHV